MKANKVEEPEALIRMESNIYLLKK